MNSPPQIAPSFKPSSDQRALRIDAHHHLWLFNEAEYTWIDDGMAVLRRDFSGEDICREMQAAKIDAAVAVQARESLEETRWLLECAHAFPAIDGVVGWVPLEAEDLSEILDRLADRKLVGLREVVQGKAAGFLDRPEFNRGIRQLTDRGLSYDLLIHAWQLEEAARFIDRHPNQRFVLDHAAKPKVAKAELEPWKTGLRSLAQRSNVSCKLSGLVTEAVWDDWTADSLRPYFDVCVEAFGTDRLLAGSDWPVCLVASTYSRWWKVLARYFDGFSEKESRRVFGENAIDMYRLPSFQARSDGTA